MGIVIYDIRVYTAIWVYRADRSLSLREFTSLVVWSLIQNDQVYKTQITVVYKI